jgi:GT2 family glycosyltransferase
VGFTDRLSRWLSEKRRSIVVYTGSDGMPRVSSRYRRWIAAHPFDACEAEKQRMLAEQMPPGLTISLVMPVFNPPPAILGAAIESALAQTYGRWELCLADGASDRAGVRAVLDEYEQRDPRIRVLRLERNLGISGNSNEAARMATGDFLMIFDHDDLLAPNALFEIATAIHAQPEADLIYYDEDMVSADGTRFFHPFMKSNWSPELLLSANYLMHSTIRRELFWSVGGFNPAFDGAQDWDLAFRCTEQARAVIHVPKVLYHWRAVPGSAAASANAKPYVFDRQLGCIAEHLRRREIDDVTTSFANHGFPRASWPSNGSKVSLITSIHDDSSRAQTLLATLLKMTDYPNLEVILAVSGKSSRAFVGGRKPAPLDARVHIVELGGECTIPMANNVGARQATGDLLLFLDSGVNPLALDWVEEMVRWAERPEIGVVGAKILDARQCIRDVGVVFGLDGAVGRVFQGARERQDSPFGNVDWYRNYSAVSGMCQMLRRDVFDQIGEFNEQLEPELSSVDLCLRVLAQGYRNFYTPYARLGCHPRRLGGQVAAASSSRGDHHLARPSIPEEDHYYNPNLSRTERIPAFSARRDIIATTHPGERLKYAAIVTAVKKLLGT